MVDNGAHLVWRSNSWGRFIRSALSWPLRFLRHVKTRRISRALKTLSRREDEAGLEAFIFDYLLLQPDLGSYLGPLTTTLNKIAKRYWLRGDREKAFQIYRLTLVPPEEENAPAVPDSGPPAIMPSQTEFEDRDRAALGFKSPRNVWGGPESNCKSLLVLGHANIINTLANASYFKTLLPLVPRLAVTVDPRLVGLMQRSFPEIEFVGLTPAAGGPKPDGQSLTRGAFEADRVTNLDLMSLLTVFDRYARADDLPAYIGGSRHASRHAGYLKTDPAKRDEWRRRLGALGSGLKVGIAWRALGNPATKWNSFTLDQLLPILQVEGVHFINLQPDAREEELDRFEQLNGIAVHRWTEISLEDDIEEEAALLRELDLVIAPSSPTLVQLAHAAGTPMLLLAPWVKSFEDSGADLGALPEIAQASWGHESVVVGNKRSVIWQAWYRLRLITEKNGDAKLWRRHSSGRHLYPLRSGPQQVEGVEVATEKIFSNTYGETFEPVGVRDIPYRAAREQELLRREKAFVETVHRLFANGLQPVDPEGVLLILGLSLKQYALTLLGAHALLDHGWASVCLDESPFELGRITNQHVAHFKGLFVKDKGLEAQDRLFHLRGQEPGLQLDWEIDFAKRICRSENINVYATITNRLGKEFRKYIADLSDPDVSARFNVLLRTSDAALSLCLEAEKRLAGRGMRVRFTGFEADYAPTGVLRLYCDERGYKHGIEFVDIRGANERYYHGGKSPLLLSAMECQNVTRHKLYSAGAIRHDLFDAWFKKKSSNDEAAEHSRHWALQNRTGLSQPSPEGKLVLDRIDRHRQSGGKVACLYGTVPFDFGCPSLDQGPAHFDRRDWYNHTVATLADTDVLLLIKPHPDEARFEQVGFPNQFFVELLDQPLPCNVVILGHHWLNNAELTPVIDFGITWRGSIASELALMRVPVVVCNANLPTGHSLAFPAPKDREDYEDLLRHPERIVLTDELVRRAALVFEFYRNEVMIPYPFGWIPHKKGKAGIPVWSEKAIQNYIQRGHSSVDEICKRIITD